MIEVSVLQILSAFALAVLAWVVNSYIRLRRDNRHGRSEDFDLFQRMRAVSLDQIDGVQKELVELRVRVTAAEDRAEKAERIAERMRLDLDSMTRHVIYLEGIMRASGIQVPPRPSGDERVPG